MRRTSLLSSVVPAFVLLAVPVRAQTVAVVTSNSPDAHVYADSTWLGPASIQVFDLPAGTRRVRVVPPTVGAWGIAPITGLIRSADTLHVDARFPYVYRFEATPVPADVFLLGEDTRERIGSTPVVVSFDWPLDGTLSFEREGFAAVALTPGDALWNRHIAVMEPLADSSPDILMIHMNAPRRTRKWIDVAAAGAAVAGGILAVHYKIKADNRYDVYRETGDPALRPRINQLDSRSAWSLGAMQAGVAVFSIRRVLR